MTNVEVPPERVAVTVRQRGDVLVVDVVGELDISNAEVLRTALDDELAAGALHVVVDLTGVAFMDSTGLGVLVRIRKLVHASQGSFALVCAEGPVRRLLTITGLVTVLGACSTLDEALASRSGATG
jgi:anti-sigma B factor antagonist